MMTDFEIIESFCLMRLINAEENNIMVDANKSREALESLSSIKQQIKKLQAENKILKDMIIADKMSKLCHCDICKEKRKSVSKDREKIARELDALIIVKELQNVKSKKNDV